MSNQWNNQNQGGFQQGPSQQNGNWRQPQGGFQNQQPQGQPQGENLYVGTGKLMESQFGRFIKLSFRADDLKQMLQYVNESGWMSVTLNPRQQPSASGATHYMKIDTWQPNQNQQQGGYQQQQGGFQQQPPQQQQFQQDGFQQSQQPQQGNWRQQGNWQPPQPDNGGFGGGYDGQEDDIPF
jgi:hypothetical protein